MIDLSSFPRGALRFQPPETAADGPARLEIFEQSQARKRKSRVTADPLVGRALGIAPEMGVVAVPSWIRPTYDALAECWEHGLDVAFTAGARLSGTLVHTSTPCPPSALRLRMAQHQYASAPEWCLDFARETVACKIENQIQHLRVQWRKRLERNIIQKVESMAVIKRRLGLAKDLDALRGYEGTAAATYFSALGEIAAGADFRRRPRSGESPQNVLFDYAYAHLARLVTLALMGRGADVAKGVLHVADGSRPALTLDLMEPLRPIIADRWVLRILGGQYRRYFEYDSDAGRWRLNSAGRANLRDRWVKWIYGGARGQIVLVEQVVRAFENFLISGTSMEYPILRP